MLGRMRADSAVSAMREPPSIVLRAADPEPCETEEHVADRSLAEHDRGAQRDAACPWQVAAEELGLPVASDIGRESGVEVGVLLGLRTIEGVAVQGRRARVHPHERRMLGTADRLVQCAGGVHPRAQDLVTVRVGVAGVHRLSGEPDHELRTVDETQDAVGVIPPRIGAVATDHPHVVSVVGESASECAAERTASPAEDGAPYAGHAVSGSPCSRLRASIC